MTSATPRPWSWRASPHKREYEAFINGPPPGKDLRGEYIAGVSTSEEDAAMIVRAVNAHDALVAVVERCRALSAVAATSSLSKAIEEALALAKVGTP